MGSVLSEIRKKWGCYLLVGIGFPRLSRFRSHPDSAVGGLFLHTLKHILLWLVPIRLLLSLMSLSAIANCVMAHILPQSAIIDVAVLQVSWPLQLLPSS